MTGQDFSSDAQALKCPVCKVRFRCKTDLSALMRIAARAWAAREQCRAALAAGNLLPALRSSSRARRLHRAGDSSRPGN